MREWIVDPELEQRLKIVLAAVGLLLLVAASNVANLQSVVLSAGWRGACGRGARTRSAA